MITIQQLAMARAGVRLSLQAVADTIGIGVQALSDIESGKTNSPKASTINALQGFYEGCGLEFTELGGVRPNNAEVKSYDGDEGFRHFYNDIFNTIKSGGSISIQNGMPDYLIKHLGQEFYDMHSKRMIKLSPDVRVIVRRGDKNLIGSSFARYRFVDDDMFNEQTIYIYANKVAFITFDGGEVAVKVLDMADITQSLRITFDMLWGLSNELR
jgi:transcriptional regulator with XRE-family HTH domain